MCVYVCVCMHVFFYVYSFFFFYSYGRELKAQRCTVHQRPTVTMAATLQPLTIHCQCQWSPTTSPPVRSTCHYVSGHRQTRPTPCHKRPAWEGGMMLNSIDWPAALVAKSVSGGYGRCFGSRVQFLGRRIFYLFSCFG